MVTSPALSVVRRALGITLETSAGMITGRSRSVRSNTMPWSGGAGMMVSVASRPSMSPLPVTTADAATVRWRGAPAGTPRAALRVVVMGEAVTAGVTRRYWSLRSFRSGLESWVSLRIAACSRNAERISCAG